MIPPEPQAQAPVQPMQALANLLAAVIAQGGGSGGGTEQYAAPQTSFGAQLEGGYTPYGSSPFIQAAAPRPQQSRDFVPATWLTPAQRAAEAKQRAAFIASIQNFFQNQHYRPSFPRDPYWGGTTGHPFPWIPPRGPEWLR